MRLAIGTGVRKVGAGLILGRDRPQMQGVDIGATCEGVAKILAEWRGLGWVAQSRGTVRIADRPAPDAIAHADIN
jgi:hypothetical protein